ncbi:restriction endonuclease subunit S [Faecalibacter bovis]|uniref:Restriction endonuclease subunit S n=1 Tax=Faecalibacter bovis TaxID=2898187 RepID=A0ABX7XC39_9FLAO|nr:restriction endonuclease subunit S [Faecalibacter bovis]QTV05357.1 restriction endonuclease subunit S [Faecalibacter bovis]
MSYKKLGDYIQQVNNRNRDLQVDTLLGVSITKKLIPSIANTVGTDMSTYKIIEKGQFAYGTITSRNGDKISIALADEYEKALVSQIYIVFEVIDKNELLPEYLMMWFSRPEFDRYARYHSHGSTRESFDWEDLCEVELPVPSIEKQREIVAQYQAVAKKIKVNEQICEKLDATAQTLYKQWFVDFEFPNEEGKPYKSSGGAMVYNQELEKEIPGGWVISNLGDITYVIDCLHSKKPEEIKESNSQNILLQVNNIGKYGLLDLSKKYNISDEDYELWTSRIELNNSDCFITNVGVDGIAQIPKGVNAALGRNMTALRLKEGFNFPSFLITLLLSDYMKKEIDDNKDTGTVMQALNVSTIPKLRFLNPTLDLVEIFDNNILIIRKKLENLFLQNQKLTQLQSLMLSRLATLEG